jgi:hypothetical protein
LQNAALVLLFVALVVDVTIGELRATTSAPEAARSAQPNQ